ncbi:MAG: hypothetical protein ACR2FO_05600 [Actinomycetota bacterium]
MAAFRKGMIIGFGIGYVKGSKAGRERYEQIRKNWNKVKATPAYQSLNSKAQELIGNGLIKGRLAALDAVTKASSKIRHPVTGGSSNGHESKYSST